MSLVNLVISAHLLSSSRFFASSTPNPKKYEHLMELDEQRDQLRRDAMQRSADQWVVDLLKSLHCLNQQIESEHKHDQCPSGKPQRFLFQEADQERIYKILLDGFICNYHRMVSWEQIKPLLVCAIKVIKLNHLIFSKMTMNPKKVPTPFQRLYWWNAEMRDVLADVAECGSWEWGNCAQNREIREIAAHQEVLQRIKANVPGSHIITADGDPLINALESIQSHFERLRVRNPSAIELQIAVTLFQLTIDIRPYVQASYEYSSTLKVNHFYNMLTKHMIALTYNDAKAQTKTYAILLHKAPDLTSFFRDHLLIYGEKFIDECGDDGEQELIEI